MAWNDHTCDLDELDHVIHAHLDTPLTVDGLCRMTKEDLACAIIALRREWHREREVDSAEWIEENSHHKQAEARVAEMERKLAGCLTDNEVFRLGVDLGTAHNRIKELERELAWLRRSDGVRTCHMFPEPKELAFMTDVRAHLASKPPEGWTP